MSLSRAEDLHADPQRPSGAGRLFQLQGVLLLREAELPRRLQEEQRDEPGQEQPGEALPLFSTSSPRLHTFSGLFWGGFHEQGWPGELRRRVLAPPHRSTSAFSNI